MNLTPDLYGQLVSLALNKRAGWIPARPLAEAKHRKLHLYNRANVVAALISAGLVDGKPSKTGETVTLRLTSEGKAAILAMPDVLPGEVWFPLPRDIARAKAKLSQS